MYAYAYVVRRSNLGRICPWDGIVGTEGRVVDPNLQTRNSSIADTRQYSTTLYRNAQSSHNAETSTHTEIILLLHIMTPGVWVQIGWKMLLAIRCDWNIADPERGRRCRLGIEVRTGKLSRSHGDRHTNLAISRRTSTRRLKK